MLSGNEATGAIPCPGAHLAKAANALYLLCKAGQPAPDLPEAARMHRRASDYTHLSELELATEAHDLSQRVSAHKAALKKDCCHWHSFSNLNNRFMKSILFTLLLIVCLAIPFTGSAQRFVGFSSQVQQLTTVPPTKTDSTKTTSTKTTSTKTDSTKTTSTKTTFTTTSPLTKTDWETILLGDGDFSKALSSDGNSNTGAPKTGSLGFTFVKPRDDSKSLPQMFQGNLTVSLGSQGDTLIAHSPPTGSHRIPNQLAFGQSLLIPGSNAKAARSFSIFMQWFPGKGNKFSERFGLNGYINVTQTRWGYQQLLEDARLFSSSGGISYSIVHKPSTTSSPNTVDLIVYANYAYRNIGGDVREEVEIIEKAFGERKYDFHGVEPGFIFSVNNLRLAMSFPAFKGSVKGFSNGQFIASLGFSSGIGLGK